MSTSSFFQIPGNIKQSLLPFVLNPSAGINKSKKSSSNLKGVNPQKFSYKYYGSTGGALRIFPKSFDNYIENDISFQSLYAYSDLDGTTATYRPFKSTTICNFLPTIQVREFLPDTRLDQCINFFGDLYDTMKTLFTDNKDSQKQNSGTSPQSQKSEKNESFFKKLTSACKWSINYLTGVSKDNLYTSIQNKISSNGASTWYAKTDQSLKNYILNFPYLLYYRMQSCVTTNIYELPGQCDNNLLYSSDGSPGWNGTSKFELINMLFKQNGILNSLLGNIRVHFLPWWDSSEGSSTAEPTITIKFDLFNDSLESSIYNFIFVNTIIPNNKWIQYNIFEHSPSIYDIKIDGYKRLFACTGKFDVGYKGVLRWPSKLFLDTLVNKHLNKCCSLDVNTILTERLIKIPDIYTVTMTFESILPTNFNNYIYQYSHNKSIISDINSIGYKKSVASDILNDGIKSYTEKLKSRWESNNWD